VDHDSSCNQKDVFWGSLRSVSELYLIPSFSPGLTNKGERKSGATSSLSQKGGEEIWKALGGNFQGIYNMGLISHLIG